MVERRIISLAEAVGDQVCAKSVPFGLLLLRVVRSGTRVPQKGRRRERLTGTWDQAGRRAGERKRNCGEGRGFPGRRIKGRKRSHPQCPWAAQGRAPCRGDAAGEDSGALPVGQSEAP